jgi:hypothetical protein
MCIFAKLSGHPLLTEDGNAETTFVGKTSIVRKIWGNSDVVLFIFAGAAAEFALNRSVDWLYFTGKLPNDPLERMFSTVDYARRIIFANERDALAAIDTINAIHKGVEKQRGMRIPQQSYKDVLNMLIDYSIRAYELLQRKLSACEKEEIYHVFYRMGIRMGIDDLPPTYTDWLPERAIELQEHLVYSKYTEDLFRQYRRHLGSARYGIMLQVQALLLPTYIKELIGIKEYRLFGVVIGLYRVINKMRLGNICKRMLLPTEYRERIMRLNVA